MKRLIATLLALLLFPSIALAVKTLPYAHESAEFADAYNKASSHKATMLGDAKWFKLEGRIPAVLLGNDLDAMLLVTAHPTTGQVETVDIHLSLEPPYENLKAHERIRTFLLPALYRVINMYVDCSAQEFEEMLEAAEYDDFLKIERRFMLDDGSYWTGAVFKEEVGIVVRFFPETGNIGAIVGYVIQETQP